MKVSTDDYSRDFAAERRREPLVYRDRHQIKIKIAPRGCRHRRPECQRNVPSMLQLIESAVGQSQDLKKFTSCKRLHRSTDNHLLWTSIHAISGRVSSTA